MRQQVLIGLRSWLAAAVLVAMAVLLGASAGGVVAARATPARVAVGGGHAEADATPAGTTAPDDGNAEVVARKVIDADGDLDTIDDQTAGEGWEFELVVANGEIKESFPITSSSGFAGWMIETGPGGTSVTVSEVAQENFALVDAVCMWISESGNTSVGEFNEGSVTFRTGDVGFSSFQCDFFNVPTDMSTAEISVFKHVDTDGDLDTFEDLQSPRSWEFQATFEDDVEIVAADSNTNRDEPAGWVIKHAGELKASRPTRGRARG